MIGMHLANTWWHEFKLQIHIVFACVNVSCILNFMQMKNSILKAKKFKGLYSDEYIACAWSK